MQDTDVIVIGAGMSGLIAARDLHRRGIDAVSYTHLTLPTILRV